MAAMRALCMAILGTAVVAVSTGCVRRTIAVSSTPAGAAVQLNGRQVGRTPCEVDFTHYGIYDLHLTLAGYEPVIGGGDAKAPLWDFLGADLVAELVPTQLHSRVEWHFDLHPTDMDRAGLWTRAAELRAITAAGGQRPRQGVASPFAPIVHPEDTMELPSQRAGVPMPPTYSVDPPPGGPITP